MDKKKRAAVIAGNWKMNKTPSEAKKLIEELRPLTEKADCGVIICVPFVDLETAVRETAGTKIKVGAQNCHWAKDGAFTGEISADMLKELGAEYVVIGHSERRQYFGETDETVNMRIKAALEGGLKVIFCCGELLAERRGGIMAEIIGKQVKIGLSEIPAEQLENIIVAYEPVWAIGTGVTASSEQAESACAFIRGIVANLYGKENAEAMTIQYGGSMKPDNAAELLSKRDVDGGLIGGASLKAPDFAAIVNAASEG